MKKKTLAVVMAVLLLSLTFPVLAASPIRFVINGQEAQPTNPPQIVNGRTMVPVRWIAENLGATVDWDVDSQTIQINQPKTQSGLDSLAQELEKQVAGLVDRQFQHYRIVEKNIKRQAFTMNSSRMEAEYMINVHYQMGVITPADWPPQQGRIQYLNETQDKLSPAALHKVKESIAAWDKELQLYIDTPQEGNDFIKVSAELGDDSRIKEDTVRVYREGGTGEWLPLDLNDTAFQSAEQIAQIGYEEMKKLAE